MCSECRCAKRHRACPHLLASARHTVQSEALGPPPLTPPITPSICSCETCEVVSLPTLGLAREHLPLAIVTRSQQQVTAMTRSVVHSMLCSFFLLALRRRTDTCFQSRVRVSDWRATTCMQWRIARSSYSCTHAGRRLGLLQPRVNGCLAGQGHRVSTAQDDDVHSQQQQLVSRLSRRSHHARMHAHSLMSLPCPPRTLHCCIAHTCLCRSRSELHTQRPVRRAGLSDLSSLR
jgi:hypothetical protein